MTRHPALVAGVLLTLFAMAGGALVAFTHEQTEAQILENERQSLLRKLHALVPPERIDNDPIADRIVVHHPELLGAESTRVYRARSNGRPVAAVFAPVVAKGYTGPIHLLVAVRADGTLEGVRVLSHKETPGLGDKIEAEKTDWIRGFEGRSLGDPPVEQWGVKRDGGAFDQLTGATVSPRAVVQAVKNTLIYFREAREQVLARPAEEGSETAGETPMPSTSGSGGSAEPAPTDAVYPSLGARLRPSRPQTPLERVPHNPLPAAGYSEETP